MWCKRCSLQTSHLACIRKALAGEQLNLSDVTSWKYLWLKSMAHRRSIDQLQGTLCWKAMKDSLSFLQEHVTLNFISTLHKQEGLPNCLFISLLIFRDSLLNQKKWGENKSLHLSKFQGRRWHLQMFRLEWPKANPKIFNLQLYKKRQKQQILTQEKLQPETVWHFCWEKQTQTTN